MPNDKRLVSILLVNYNGARFLRDCLDSLRKVAYKPFEMVLVDNASTDGSLNILESYPEVKVVRSDKNLGFAGGNNLGLKHCQGRYVLLLNTDTVAVPDFLESLVSYLEAHPEVGVTQGKMTLSRYEHRLDVCGSFLTIFGMPYHYGYYKHDGPLYTRSYPVFSGKGACLLFRRNIIERVGGFLFDEDFFCYYEESDFCHRVWLAGSQVHFVASPPIQHFQGGTSGDSQSEFVLSHYLGNMLFSLSGNLSFSWRLRILPPLVMIVWASMILSFVRGEKSKARAHWVAFLSFLKRRQEVSARRYLVHKIRTVEDRVIFRQALRNPSLDYFVKTFNGKLTEYHDR